MAHGGKVSGAFNQPGVDRERPDFKMEEYWPEPPHSERESLLRLAEEHAVMLEIARIINSTLNIEEVYEKFARAARKLIPCDRVVVNLINAEDQTFTHAYVSGIEVSARRVGDLYPLAGSGVEEVMRRRCTLSTREESMEDLCRRLPALCPVRDRGFRSMIIAPLISDDRVIGVLNFISLEAGAYSEKEVRLAESIGAQIAGAISNARLFSERRLAEKALRESEQRYRTLVENATEAIFIIQDDRIKFHNSQTLAMLGYPESDLASMPAGALLKPYAEDGETPPEPFPGRTQDAPASNTCRLLNKAGEEIWGHFNSVPISWDGRPATLNFLRDITREKKLENQFQTAQKMEAIGTLAGGIAHDFNNLLMGIKGYVSLMLFDLDASHPHYENLKKIEDQVKSGADLAGQLLGFARRGKYEVKASDLNKIIGHTAGIFERTKKEIEVDYNLQEGLWASEVDRGQIEQALMNLYVNAWQAMPEGGKLYLETRNVTLGPDYIKPFAIKLGEYVRISVRDTGVGMDRKTQQRIFEPFFTTKKMGRGTGLGLASVYGIVKGHGGFINVYSEIGHGTVFNIYLPASGQKIPVEKKAAGEILTGSESILLVDDEETITEVMGKALTLTGYKVFLARGGEEALRIYAKDRDRIDVVVLDMIMPGMNGGKVFDRLREMDPGVKVILSSGYSIDGDAAQIMARGCNGFIQKPFGIKELSLKIREILGKS
ncbi:MAG TPA: response regulator [Thermodesulfobacteriota bacterium]|nr:response regulator [Thermodesulfobacteriota bacterium]